MTFKKKKKKTNKSDTVDRNNKVYAYFLRRNLLIENLRIHSNGKNVFTLNIQSISKRYGNRQNSSALNKILQYVNARELFVTRVMKFHVNPFEI